MTRVAWSFIALGLGGAFLADAAALRDPAAWFAWREAQTALIRSAFFLLLMDRLLSVEALAGLRRQAARVLTPAALFYALGFCVLQPGLRVLVPIAGMANAVVLAWCFARVFSGPAPIFVRSRTLVIAFGVLVDVALALCEWDPGFTPDWLGAADGVRLRMLRLARIAAIALPLLATLHEDLLDAADVTRRHVRWGRRAIRFGAVGMPIALVLTALTWVARKGLVFVFTVEMIVGTAIAALLAYRQRRWVESSGWALVLLSMLGGLVVSTFAFNGPLPVPASLGAYLDVPRTLIRQVHVYGIVVGVVTILLARGPYSRR